MSTTTQKINEFFGITKLEFEDEQVMSILKRACDSVTKNLTSQEVNNDTYLKIEQYIECELNELKNKYEVLDQDDEWFIRPLPCRDVWTIQVRVGNNEKEFRKDYNCNITFFEEGKIVVGGVEMYKCMDII